MKKESDKKIKLSTSIKQKQSILHHRSNKLTYQHNKLIEAKYDLTLQEKRIIIWSLANMTPEDIGLKSLSIPIQEFCKVVGITDNSAYSQIKKITMKLRNRGMTITDLDEKTHTQVGWLDHVTYYEKEGRVEIQFHRFLSQFLVELKANFTAIPLSQTLGLSSIYAIRIFELLKQYEKIGKRKISLSELRLFCGIHKDKLKNYNDIKRKVLDISQREISSKTDIIFSFETIKTSRKVTDIVFTIKKNKSLGKCKEVEQSINQKEISIYNNEMKERLSELGFTRTAINNFYKSYDDQRISKAYYVVKVSIDTGKANNPKALFRAALKGDWSTDQLHTG